MDNVIFQIEEKEGTEERTQKIARIEDKMAIFHSRDESGKRRTIQLTSLPQNGDWICLYSTTWMSKYNFDDEDQDILDNSQFTVIGRLFCDEYIIVRLKAEI